MNIICDHDFRKLIENVNGYELDLGRAYTKKDDLKNIIEVNIKDEFVILFLRKYKRLIYKVGRLGPINIYTYDSLPLNKIWIFDDDVNNGKKIEIDFDKQLAQINFRKYFANIVYQVKN